MRYRVCNFHSSGKPPEWSGPFYVKGCRVCEEKVTAGKTTREAPNPEARLKAQHYRPQCGDEAFQKWCRGLSAMHAKRRVYMRSLKLRNA